jgi:GTP-binding protein
VLADVGLVGLPNAGKSTLIGAMSAARPKVADYPFTTLYPHLGVVKVAQFRSFVMADLPGLIMGAAEGAGLGTRFLKHVTRTHLLLHVVEVMPADGSDPADHVRAITRELGKFNSDLLMKERWLVLNKADQLASDIAKQHCDAITQSLGWTGKVFIVSGLDKQGLGNLSQQIMSYLEKKEHHLN